MAKDRIAWLPGDVDAALFGATAAYKKLPAGDRDRSSPATLVQMLLLRRHHVAILDRRSFGRIGSDGPRYLSIATALGDPKIGLKPIHTAVTDVDGFQQFTQEGTHLC